MTPAAFRRMALGLPQAHEEPHFERASFRVGKKIFATMTREGDEAMVRVEPEGVEALLDAHPDIFFSYGGWTIRNGSLGVRLAKIDSESIKPLLLDSYKHSAPKRLAEEIEHSKAKTKPRKGSAPSKRATSKRAG